MNRFSIYTAVGLKTEVLGDSTRERNFSFQTELSITGEKLVRIAGAQRQQKTRIFTAKAAKRN
ncbi:MAG: hypothetical protein R3C14_22065 [Caldilineaceae bacterium]